MYIKCTHSIFTLTFIILFFLLFVGSAAGQAGSKDVLREYNVKAAFLLRLPEFINWEKKSLDKKTSFDVCVLSSYDNYGNFDQLNGKLTKGLPINIIETNQLDLNPDECMVIYVSKGFEKSDVSFIKKLNDMGCLVVGETNSIVHNGASIGLVVIDNKINLQVNLEATSGAGLKIDSELLKLSTIVRMNLNNSDSSIKSYTDTFTGSVKLIRRPTLTLEPDYT